jgi:hypothetical protein
MQQLCFEYSKERLSYFLFEKNGQAIIRTGFINLTGRISDLKKERCAAFLRDEGIEDFEGEVSLAIISERVTLVPQNIFGETSAKEVFEFCFGKCQESVDHNRFFEQALVVVYEIEDWIKRFFVLRFPKIAIQHEITHALRGIFDGPTYEPKLHLVVNATFFELILVSKSKIIFFNTFDYTCAEDLFYYSIHAWTNGIKENKKMQVLIHTNDSDQSIFEAFKSLVEAKFNNHSLEFVSKAKSQLLCV